MSDKLDLDRKELQQNFCFLRVVCVCVCVCGDGTDRLLSWGTESDPYLTVLRQPAES